MKILYFSSPSFMDADLEILSELRNLEDIIYLCDLHKSSQKATILNIDTNHIPTGIVNFNELKDKLPSFFSKYISFDKAFFIHRKSGGFLNIWKQIRDLRQFLKKVNPDLIHLSLSLPVPYIIFLFWPYRKILTIHDPLPHSGEHSTKKEMIKALAIRRSEKIILLNNKDVSAFQKAFKVPDKKIFISGLCTYGIYKEFIDEFQQKQPFNILFYGRISPYKGIEFLCKAIVEVRKYFPALTLLVMGKGHYWFDTSKYKTEGIQFINDFVSNSELALRLQRAHIVVCPYTDATQSGVVMTALGFKKVVLATRVGGIPEVIKHNVTGILSNPSSVDSLVDALLYCFNNPDKIDEIEKNLSDENISSFISPLHVAQGISKIYHH